MTVSWLLSRFPSRSGPRSAAPFVRPRPNSIPIARRTLFGSASAGAAAATASGSAAFLPHISDSLLPIILGIILYARRQQEDEATSDQLQLSGPWTVQESSKGMAVFATRDIKRGETLLSENPLLVWDIDADAAATKKLVARLSSEARKQFFSLANALPNSNELDPELGVRGTNGFNVQLPPLPRDVATGHELQAFTQTGSPSHATMIFPRVARLNHSCLPNADHAIDWTTLQMTVYATTDIPSGSEINIEYQAALIQKTRSKRREQLYEAFGFTCACSACAPASEELVQASDARRSEIDTLVGRLRDDGANKKRAEVFAGMKRLKGLLQDEGYKAMPEFNDSSVSKAFAFWSSTAPDA